MTAISAYHNQLTIEEEPVGQGISVCNLVTDAFNKNPPKPKYIFIWDVEKVKPYPLIHNCQIEPSTKTNKLVVSHFCRPVPRDLLLWYTFHSKDCFIIKKIKVNKVLEKRGIAAPRLELRENPKDGFMCNDMS